MATDDATAGGREGQKSKLSHDLRQPLAALKTWIELLGRTLGDQPTDKQRRYLEKIDAEMKRMIGVLDALSRAAAAPDDGTSGPSGEG